MATKQCTGGVRRTNVKAGERRVPFTLILGTPRRSPATASASRGPCLAVGDVVFHTYGDGQATESATVVSGFDPRQASTDPHGEAVHEPTGVRFALRPGYLVRDSRGDLFFAAPHQLTRDDGEPVHVQLAWCANRMAPASGRSPA